MLSFLGDLRATVWGKRRDNQKRAYCYRQLLCAAAAAGERPSRSCASTWHFFGAGDGAPSGVGAPSGTGAGVASGCTAAKGSLELRTNGSLGFAALGHVAGAS